MNKQTTKDNTLIALNKKARYEYTIEERYEAGVMLEGWEVKSLRSGRAQVTDSYVVLRNGEAWMVGSHFTPLVSASTHVHPEPDRSRKLLLHAKELTKLIGLVERRGYSLVVLSLYWKKNKVKVEVALGKGKKTYDKRADLKEKDWQRQQQRNFKEA
jgi:SsrA-binding protein